MMHTPGKWEIEIGERYGCTYYYLKETQGGEHGEEAEANACLMEASPDMLKALVIAEQLLDSVAFVSKQGDTDKPLRAIRAAIAKSKPREVTK